MFFQTFFMMLFIAFLSTFSGVALFFGVISAIIGGLLAIGSIAFLLYRADRLIHRQAVRVSVER
ncbi:hypothetical protein AAD018_007100 [Aestuariibius insulae]|uniref:hypothetical protein n=1 Tax=Aestuariibius insulae TaxID=2058287 RepID=UPI00345ECB01